ncbi:MAG: hypothetical protein Q8P54_02185 [bacterium]|nr:hypothetical protein [bacterium]
MILAIKTDANEAELYILKESGMVIDKYQWKAGRQLADTLLPKIKNLLKKNSLDFKNLSGVCVFSGEGSFTGLRIGTSLSNALAYSLDIKVFKTKGKDWLSQIPHGFKNAKSNEWVIPDYDREPNITKPN